MLASQPQECAERATLKVTARRLIRHLSAITEEREWQEEQEEERGQGSLWEEMSTCAHPDADPVCLFFAIGRHRDSLHEGGREGTSSEDAERKQGREKERQANLLRSTRERNA